MTLLNTTTNYYDAIKNRRSIYGLSKEEVISDERIQEIVEHAVKYVPSAFNSQTARVVVLLGDNHTKFWGITTETLKAMVAEDKFASTQEKMDSFNAGYGTVLFFEDMSIIEGLQTQFPSYADNFPVWSLQSSGMLQYTIWTALESEGYGASLQHYNPLIDEEVKTTWNLPSSWKLLAQMPFGKPTAEPNPNKEFQPVENRVKVIK